MKITVELKNEIYIIDTEKTPNILNPKQIELIMHMLDIPYKDIIGQDKKI